MTGYWRLFLRTACRFSGAPSSNDWNPLDPLNHTSSGQLPSSKGLGRIQDNCRSFKVPLGAENLFSSDATKKFCNLLIQLKGRDGPLSTSTRALLTSHTRKFGFVRCSPKAFERRVLTSTWILATYYVAYSPATSRGAKRSMRNWLPSPQSGPRRRRQEIFKIGKMIRRKLRAGLPNMF